MKNSIKIACLAVLLVSLLGFGRTVKAGILTLSPDSLSVLIGPLPGSSFPDTNFIDTNFSTHADGPQETVVATSNASLLAALQSALGPAPGYVINSARLTVGSDADDYSPGGMVNGYVLLESYVPNQVTYNSRATGTPWSAPGALAGTDYDATAATTATPTPGHLTTETDFDGLGPVVQNWLDNPSQNLGLIFLNTTFGDTAADFTDWHNVVWTIDATALPEPASMTLLAGGAMLLLRRRRA